MTDELNIVFVYPESFTDRVIALDRQDHNATALRVLLLNNGYSIHIHDPRLHTISLDQVSFLLSTRLIILSAATSNPSTQFR